MIRETSATPSPSGDRLGFWLSLVGAVAFSGKAIVVKLLLREGVDGITSLGLRMILAAPLFALMALRGGLGQEKHPRAVLLRIAVLGFSGYYLASTLDFLGLEHVSASLERLILYVYPTIVLALGRLRGHPPISRRQWIATVLCYAGVFAAFGAEAGKSTLATTRSSHEVLLGAALVLASAVAYAVYIVLSGELVGKVGALRLTGWASGAASVFCIAQFAVVRPERILAPWTWMTPRIFVLCLVNATLCTAMPMWMVMRGIQGIGSAKAAQVGMVGPLSTILLAVLLLGERLTAPMLAGTALVLAGIALLSRN
ncbi:MAG TPA: DMT family transporter [Polyangiaceae bacterium]|nr:DMT family transporter [Polyangiaceae bacterium]